MFTTLADYGDGYISGVGDMSLHPSIFCARFHVLFENDRPPPATHRAGWKGQVEGRY